MNVDLTDSPTVIKVSVVAPNPRDAMSLLCWIFDYTANRTSARFGPPVNPSRNFLISRKAFACDGNLLRSENHFEIVVDSAAKVRFELGCFMEPNVSCDHFWVILNPGLYLQATVSSLMREFQVAFGIDYRTALELACQLTIGLRPSDVLYTKQWKQIEFHLDKGDRESADMVVDLATSESGERIRRRLADFVHDQIHVIEIEVAESIARFLNRAGRAVAHESPGLGCIDVLFEHVPRPGERSRTRSAYVKYTYSRERFLAAVDYLSVSPTRQVLPRKVLRVGAFVYSFFRASSFVLLSVVAIKILNEYIVFHSTDLVTLRGITIGSYVALWTLLAWLGNPVRKWSLLLADDGSTRIVQIGKTKHRVKQIKAVESGILFYFLGLRKLCFDDSTCKSISGWRALSGYVDDSKCKRISPWTGVKDMILAGSTVCVVIILGHLILKLFNEVTNGWN